MINLEISKIFQSQVLPAISTYAIRLLHGFSDHRAFTKTNYLLISLKNNETSKSKQKISRMPEQEKEKKIMRL